MRVVLVTMPFASIDRPALGVSTLKGSLQGVGIECLAFYFNVAFAERLGEADYSRLSSGVPHASLAGEWVFAECLYGRDTDRDAEYVRRVLERTWRLPRDDLDVVRRARSASAAFLDDCLASWPWGDYDVLGFSSFCAQNIASLAFAKLVKNRHPDLLVAFGGHNWEGPMGRELFGRYPFVDVAFSGHADTSFLAFLQHVGRGGHSPAGIPGMMWRRRGRTRVDAGIAFVDDLDSLPIPDHEDYFDTLSKSRLSSDVRPVVSVETTRGCWWAAREPCRFCGLNGPSPSFRSKSPDRVLHELRWLSRRWRGHRLVFVDNVVSPLFLSTVLPRLVTARLQSSISFMVRCDIGQDHVRLIKAVDGSIRSGIESLSGHLLKLMGKGTTALDNIRLLKWCAAYGVENHWNLLYACPGETPRDYRDMIAIVASLRFLTPPDSWAPLLVERFSPYFHNPAGFGFGQIEPLEAYRFVYPFPDSAVRRIAYFFTNEYRAALGTRIYIERLRTEVERWQASGARGSLAKETGADGGLVLVDSRNGGITRHRLDRTDELLYEACDDIGKLADLHRFAREDPENGASSEEVDRRLASLVERRLMIREEDRYLSLALPDERTTASGKGGRASVSATPSG